jgi:DNA-binding IclR family transcriptional regulator
VLRRVLTDVRSRGYAVEDGEVTPGFASVATAATDHTGHPVAGVAVTFPSEHPSTEPVAERALAEEVRRTAGQLTRRVGGRAT